MMDKVHWIITTKGDKNGDGMGAGEFAKIMGLLHVITYEIVKSFDFDFRHLVINVCEDNMSIASVNVQIQLCQEGHIVGLLAQNGLLIEKETCIMISANPETHIQNYNGLDSFITDIGQKFGLKRK